MINASTFQGSLRSAVVVPLLGLLLIVVILFLQVNNLLEAAQWTDHTYKVILEMRALRNAALRMQISEQNLLLTQETAYGDRFAQNKSNAETSILRLSQMITDNPSQEVRLKAIKSDFDRWQAIAQKQQTAAGRNDYSPQTAQLQGMLDTLERQFDDFQGVEEKLLRERTTATRETGRVTRLLVAGLALLFGSGITVFIRRQLVTLAGSYNGALASVQEQADALRRSSEEISRNSAEIQALNTMLEQRVQERTAQLEASNKELEAFSYSVSHDLRAPLRSIDGFSQALLEDYGEVIDAEGKKYLERLRNNSRQMAGLIDDLLALSRLTRAEMKRAPVDLADLARSVAEELRQREPDRRVTIDIADNLKAEGDERLLRVALENLLGNAWKFTSKISDAHIEVGQELIALDPARQETTGPGLEARTGERVFFVRDNGAGFDMAYADKLFGAFQRLHGVSEFEGTGIGLATVQRVIRRHGGRIWAQGEVGKGATLYFTLSG